MRLRNKLSKQRTDQYSSQIHPLLHPHWPFDPGKLPFFYGWAILAACTIGIIMSIPGQTMGVSVFTDYLIQATGVSRLQLSNAYLIGTVTSGLLLPFGGVFLDRFGTRLSVVLASVWLGLTLGYMSVCDRIAISLSLALHFPNSTYIAFGLLVLGFTSLRFSGQGMLTLSSRNTLGKWFDKRRGLASGIAGIFISFGFAATPSLLNAWIEAVTWRWAWVGMGLIVGLGMSSFGWIFYRDNPEECGLSMDGKLALSAPDPLLVQAEQPRDFTRGEALRTLAFWSVTLALSCQALAITGITFHIVDLGAEMGLTKAHAVALFLPMALVSTLTGSLMGLAADRIRLQFLFMGMMTALGVGIACMANLDSAALRGLAIAGLGASGGCFGTLSAVALPRFFGRTHLGAISGVQMMSIVFASAIGPSWMALFKDFAGSYKMGLYCFCLFPPIILVLNWVAPNPRSQIH
ncbi:MFS transporter [Acaryochloris sp. IP29b_bin.137]|uniref:MFS transporter n=1 Tax=Acaryochloris sp. IP29b_bin.137 TaxID=2969217 RepID=UPI00260A1836|nr:MFS transporter [Acaryochloris sp. IP29b_bin.137]